MKTTVRFTRQLVGSVLAVGMVLLTIQTPAVLGQAVPPGEFAEFQLIPTHSAKDWEFFTVGSDHFLAVANYHDGSSCNTDSGVYRWNGAGFAEFQPIPTRGAWHWEHFSIGTDHYLAVANQFDCDSLTHNVVSAIYQWDGSTFAEFQNIPTSGARDWEFFTIGADHYLVVANLYDDSTHNIDSMIYRWDGVQFVAYQSIPTNGANDWEFFTIDGDHYLVVANYYNGSTVNVDSIIYKWNGTSFAEVQSILTTGAIDWESFIIDGEHYLAVANGHDDAHNRSVNSRLYKWNGASFVEFQIIPTTGAEDWEFFTIGGRHYLAVANLQTASTFNVDSRIYEWGGTSFVQFQVISTNGADDWESFAIDGDHYLALANSHNDVTGNIHSRIYRWDGPIGATLLASASSPEVYPGDTIAVDLDIYYAGSLYAAQSECRVNPAILELQSAAFDDFFDPVNRLIAANEISPTLGTWLGAISQQNPAPPLSGDGNLATITYQALAPGTTDIVCDPLFSDRDGFTQTVSFTSTDITVLPYATINGTATYQGRLDHAGIAVDATGPVTRTGTTDSVGDFALGQLRTGTYTITADVGSYLPNCTSVTLVAGDEVMLPTTRLLGGDLNDDVTTNIGDATLLTASFNETVPPADARADINADGVVNVQDLAILAGNYERTGCQPW